MSYPANWPKCACGQPVLDAHLTCGRSTCREAEARARARRAWQPHRIQIPDREGGTDVSTLMLAWLSRLTGRRIPRC